MPTHALQKALEEDKKSDSPTLTSSSVLWNIHMHGQRLSKGTGVHAALHGSGQEMSDKKICGRFHIIIASSLSKCIIWSGNRLTG